MISTIRNPTLRRMLLIAALLTVVPFKIGVEIGRTLYECAKALREEIPEAWRGEANQ